MFEPSEVVGQAFDRAANGVRTVQKLRSAAAEDIAAWKAQLKEEWTGQMGAMRLEEALDQLTEATRRIRGMSRTEQATAVTTLVSPFIAGYLALHKGDVQAAELPDSHSHPEIRLNRRQVGEIQRGENHNDRSAAAGDPPEPQSTPQATPASESEPDVERYTLSLPLVFANGEVTLDPTAITPDPKPSSTPTPGPTNTPIIPTETPTPSPSPTPIIPTETPTPTETPGTSFRLSPDALVYESDDSWEKAREAARYSTITQDTHEFQGVRDNGDGTLTAFFTDRSNPDDEINLNATPEELARMGFSEEEIRQAIESVEAMDDKRVFTSPSMDLVSDPLNPDQLVYFDASTQASTRTATMGDINLSVELGEFTSFDKKIIADEETKKLLPEVGQNTIDEVNTDQDDELLETSAIASIKRWGFTNTTEGCVHVVDGSEGKSVKVLVKNTSGEKTNWADSADLPEVPHSLDIQTTDGGNKYQIIAFDKDGNILYESRIIERDPGEIDGHENYGYVTMYGLDTATVKNGGLRGARVKADLEADHSDKRKAERNLDGETLREQGGDIKIIADIDNGMLANEDLAVLAQRLPDGIRILDQDGYAHRASSFNSISNFVHEGPFDQTANIGIDSYRWMGPNYTQASYREELIDAVRMNDNGVVTLANIVPNEGFRIFEGGPQHAAILYRAEAAERGLPVEIVWMEATTKIIKNAGGTLEIHAPTSRNEGDLHIDNDFTDFLNRLTEAGISSPTILLDAGHGGVMGELSPREFEARLADYIGDHAIDKVAFRNLGMKTNKSDAEIDEYWKVLVRMQNNLYQDGKASSQLGVKLFDSGYYFPHSTGLTSLATETVVVDGKEQTVFKRGYELNRNYYALERALELIKE